MRTRRVEVLDESDRVRIVIGCQPGESTHGLPVLGIALLGPNGSVRADLTDDAAGAKLTFVSSGNEALQLGVEEPTPWRWTWAATTCSTCRQATTTTR